MSDILCVTNRILCKDDFLLRIENIAKCIPAGIILREKDLPETEYKTLAVSVISICRKYNVPCILHSFVNMALELESEAIHLPLGILRDISPEGKAKFNVVGASCHSVEDAIEAEKLGCTYITAGHIFATDCKRDVPARGIEFLHNVCKSVSIPVYAIGGIDKNNISLVLGIGASGACIMSGLMQCDNVEMFMNEIK